MSESLPDRLAGALMNVPGRDGFLVTERTIREALVPAVLAALTVEPDWHERVGDADLPWWHNTYVFGGNPTVWPGGKLEIERSPVGNLTPDEVEHAALVLLSVAAEMRRHGAWTGEAP